ncbi:signal peptidase I [Sphingomonas morindae]|uniref:Signal peptidase I n=1 Tax=Sphingomonas morindae TaxID=1541170 RepID=A0ABY4X9S0_9SPHN|nr:signal peptidase I [Sphingomonas morindae]USI73673.1 signal peptidase I [Sphingomonas morindae]
MNDGSDGRQIGRRVPARIGIAALNIVTPGLGLFRVGAWRAGLGFLVAPAVLMALLGVAMGYAPVTSYSSAIVAIAVISAAIAALYIAPILLTWRKSKFRSPPYSWSRWYGLVAISVAVAILMQFPAHVLDHSYKAYFAPAESMAPTIEKGDMFIVDMRWRGPLVRGTIIMFRGQDSNRVSRIAAIAGDTIEMRNGVPFVSGKAAMETAQGQGHFTGYGGPYQAAIFGERFPGEPSIHKVLDTGSSQFDDTFEATVPPNHVFVLDDDRDRAADSRVPPKLGGVGMVPVEALVGRPIYIYWSANRARIGTRLDR